MNALKIHPGDLPAPRRRSSDSISSHPLADLKRQIWAASIDSSSASHCFSQGKLPLLAQFQLAIAVKFSVYERWGRLNWGMIFHPDVAATA
jgi:hypothetical protein